LLGLLNIHGLSTISQPFFVILMHCQFSLLRS
jgi:hypothetical protein